MTANRNKAFGHEIIQRHEVGGRTAVCLKYSEELDGPYMARWHWLDTGIYMCRDETELIPLEKRVPGIEINMHALGGLIVTAKSRWTFAAYEEGKVTL